MREIAENIKLIVSAWQLPELDLARLADLSTQRLAQILAGDRPSSIELYHLADALSAEPLDLLQPNALAQRTSARFRQDAEGIGRVAPADMRLFARAEQVGRVGLKLWQKVRGDGVPANVRRQPQGLPTGHAGQAGSSLGWKMRGALGLGEAPLHNLQQVVEELGVHVARVNLHTPGLLGVTLSAEDALPVILLNESTWRVREPLLRRAVLAHELCHVLCDGGQQRAWHILSRAESNDAVESRANAFAPAFLAPWSAVDASGTPDDCVARLVRDWGLPPECASRYVQNQLKLGDDAFGRLREVAQRARTTAVFEAPTPLWGLSETQDVSPLTEGLVARLAVEAAERLLISAGRMSEILEMA